MADWPSVDDVKQVLNLVTDEWDWKASADLNAAIQYVKSCRGAWDEDTDEPTDALSQAALRMVELLAGRPDATPRALAGDPAFNGYMYGQRRQFGIA